MNEKKETGPEKLLSAFLELIEVCESFGDQYNPTYDLLQIAELKRLAASVRTALDKVEAERQVHEAASNEREALFKPLKPLVTRIVYMVQATTNSEYVLANARSIKRRIDGKVSAKTMAARKKAALTATTRRKRPVVRQSYFSQASNFADLVSLLRHHQNYKPNEVEFQVATLAALANELKDKNYIADTTLNSLSNARGVRDNVLYKETEGLVPRARAVKAYVKSVYGANSPEDKRLTKFQFS